MDNLKPCKVCGGDNLIIQTIRSFKYNLMGIEKYSSAIICKSCDYKLSGPHCSQKNISENRIIKEWNMDKGESK